MHAHLAAARPTRALNLFLLTALAGCTDTPGPISPADLAFSSAARQQAGPPASIAFHSDRAGNREIFLMSPGGADPIRLTNHPAADYYPDISANGKWVVFTSKRDGINGTTDIFLVGSDGGPAVNLTNTPTANEDWARWSPNGQQVAFHSNRTGNNEIFILDLRDGGLTQVTDYPGPDMWPEWAPDGQKLAFRRDMDVYVLDLRDGSLSRLTNLPTLDQMAAWSTDGKQLAFMSAREGYCSVFRMGADGANQVNLTPKDPGDANNTWCSRAPAWTRNGQILFMSFRPSTGGDIEIFIMDSDGTNLTRLTSTPGEDGGPTSR